LIEGNKLRLTGSMPIQTVKALQATDLRIINQPFTKDWAVEMTVIGNKNKWITELHKGKGFGISDGSFHSGTGAAAWIIEGDQLLP